MDKAEDFLPSEDGISIDRQRLSRAYARAFSGELGEIVLEDIKDFCGAGKDGFVQGAIDQTAYNLGMQRVWLHINSLLPKTNEKDK